MEGASDDSTFETQTLLAMRRFLDEAELSSHQRMPYSSAASQVTKEDTNERSAEDKGEVSAEDECRQAKAMKEVIRAFRTLLHGYEEQRCVDAQQESERDDSEAEDPVYQESPRAMMSETSKPGWEDPVGKSQRFGDSIAIESSIKRQCQATHVVRLVISRRISFSFRLFFCLTDTAAQ